MPSENAFADLPFPNPGDRIRAEDFRALSSGLLMVRDALALSGALFGQPLSQARAVLTAQQKTISRVMTVFGTEIENLDDASLDNRKVIHVLPVNLGEPGVVVVVTESVETRRFAPNLMGLTYREASERLRNIMGDVTFPSGPMNVSQLVGKTLAQAQDELTGGR